MNNVKTRRSRFIIRPSMLEQGVFYLFDNKKRLPYKTVKVSREEIEKVAKMKTSNAHRYLGMNGTKNEVIELNLACQNAIAGKDEE